MVTIICKFKSEGEDIRKTAILNDTFDKLSNSKKNEATDIIQPHSLDYDGWGVYFEVSDALGYEVLFNYDREHFVKTLIPDRAITWGGDHVDVIIDVQNVDVTIR